MRSKRCHGVREKLDRLVGCLEQQRLLWDFVGSLHVILSRAQGLEILHTTAWEVASEGHCSFPVEIWVLILNNLARVKMYGNQILICLHGKLTPGFVRRSPGCLTASHLCKLSVKRGPLARGRYPHTAGPGLAGIRADMPDAVFLMALGTNNGSNKVVNHDTTG